MIFQASPICCSGPGTTLKDGLCKVITNYLEDLQHDFIADRKVSSGRMYMTLWSPALGNIVSNFCLKHSVLEEVETN